MLRRSIDINPFALPSGEKLIRNAKVTCAALAAIALTISALDLMNVPLAKAAGTIIHESHRRIVDLPDWIGSEISSMSLMHASSSATIMTSREAPIAAQQPTLLKLASITPNVLPSLEMRTAPNARSLSPAERLHLKGTALAKAERCLTNAIYFEARGEPVSGQIAVAQVVMNRVFSGFYPNDVCDVVYQNATRHLDCQFTFACDGKSKVINERGAWGRANRIAAGTLAGDLYDPAVGTSTHYHAIYVHPDWVQEMRKFARHGIHNFYRPIAWGDGADQPIWGLTTEGQNKDKAK